jgi:hypothetical protein
MLTTTPATTAARFDPCALVAQALAELDRDDAMATLAGLSASVHTAAAAASCPVLTRTRTRTGAPLLAAC